MTYDEEVKQLAEAIWKERTERKEYFHEDGRPITAEDDWRRAKYVHAINNIHRGEVGQ